MSSTGDKGQRPNCFGCRHFFITHEPTHPYGCRAMGFKSARLPTLTVYASSGMNCGCYSATLKK